MDKLDTRQRKKIFFDILSPYFKERGFKEYLTGWDPGYVFHDSKITIHTSFNFPSDNTIVGGRVFLSFYEIEDHILKIGIPTNQLLEQRKKLKYHLPTICQRKSVTDNDRRGLKQALDIEKHAYSYIDSYKSDGIGFINKFSSLKDILDEMDKLRSNGLFWKEILDGGPEHLIKGLIISKLLDDPDYQNKFEWIRQHFESKKDEWSSYWEKYKSLLNELKS